MGQRVFAQLRIGIGPNQRASGVMGVHAATAQGGIIHGLAQGREICHPAGQPVEARRIAFECEAGVDPVLTVEHAANSCSFVLVPGHATGRRTRLRGPFCLMVGDCGTNMAMAMQQKRRPRPPLNAAKLEEMALNYVGRFAPAAPN